MRVLDSAALSAGRGFSRFKVSAVPHTEDVDAKAAEDFDYLFTWKIFSHCRVAPLIAALKSLLRLPRSGKPVGQITVTFQSPIAGDGTCTTNPLCNGTWHEGYLYTLNGGTITVGVATAYQGQAPFKDEFGFAPVIGFSVGAITNGTGKYQDISGTLTMRWDANVCICLFDIIEP